MMKRNSSNVYAAAGSTDELLRTATAHRIRLTQRQNILKRALR
jgi:hypothetical protein